MASLKKSIVRLITSWIMMHLTPRIERKVYQTRNKILNQSDKK